MSHQSVYAIAVSEGQALQIEESLTRAGFSNDEISALIPDSDTAGPSSVDGGLSSDTPTGGVLDGALEMLAGIGEMVIPGVGRLIAVGPLRATLNAVVAGAAFVGISGVLAALGIPMVAAKKYEDRIAKGNILISVHTGTAKQLKKAKEVLESAHAEDIAVTRVA